MPDDEGHPDVAEMELRSVLSALADDHRRLVPVFRLTAHIADRLVQQDRHLLLLLALPGRKFA